MFCLNKIKQLNIFEQVSELKHMITKQPVGFIKLLAENFYINTFIPNPFKEHYYSNLGKDREYELSSVLSALIIMQIFHIPTTALLTIFLIFSDELREFCGFYKSVPDESFFSRFKTTFESDLANLFDSMALKVIDICEEINNNLTDDSPMKNLNSILIYDTSGLKPRVKENNPKTLVAEVNRQKSYAKAANKENFNPYAAAYKNMPKFAQANPSIKLDFVNGHFGYFYKFGLLTNGWGIPLNIKFFDEDFYKSLDKKGKCYHTCENPCTDKKSGRMTYVYPDKDFRLYPGVQRNSSEWDETYPIRACIERSIASFKCNPCIEQPRTVNTTTMRSELYLTAISKLINVILAYAINKPEYIRR